METLGTLCLVIGLILTLGFSIQLLLLASRESDSWGCAYLLTPIPFLLFVVNYWDETRRPFLLSLLGIPFLVVGLLLKQ